MAGLFRRITEKLFRSKSVPQSTQRQAQHALKAFGGSTRKLADALGVKQRSVERYLDGSRRKPPKATAAKLEALAAQAQVTDRGRERRAKQMERQPMGTVRVRVDRAGTFQVRGSDAVRDQTVDLDLMPEQAAALARATDENDVRAVIGDALADYFNGPGTFGGFHGSDFDFDPNGVDLS